MREGCSVLATAFVLFGQHQHRWHPCKPTNVFKPITLGFTKMTAVHPIAPLFGGDAARYVEMIDALALISHKTRYSFTANEHYKRILRNDPARGMQIFWREILARSHLTALTAILRSRQWRRCPKEC